MTAPLVCREAGDDPAHRKRPAIRPGPRCATCRRRTRDAVRLVAWARGLMVRFGLTPEEYERIKDYQGGTCAICRRATGATKRLAVEHNHATGLIRGVVCGPCNWLLEKLGDDPEAYEHIVTYLRTPPATAALGAPRYTVLNRTMSENR